ncbi:MAG: hypothetical protein R3286_02595 [Gammaproteobacteria bacterium]|nr:hypothetical protein [Gammaproteobacteria bacterium]
MSALVTGFPVDQAQARNRDRVASIDRLFEKWLERRAPRDANRIRITLGAVRGLTPNNRARGTLELELATGEVSVSVQGLGRPADVWLVDNQSRMRGTLLPQAGDELEKLGELRLEGHRSTLTTKLTQDFLRAFELDLVVVTPSGGDPTATRLLLGSPSMFERRLLRRHAGAGEPDAGRVTSDPRVRLGLVSAQVLAGGELFFRGTFEGNGRTCGTCHAVDNNLVIDERFIARLRRVRPNDPLFVAEDGQPNQVPGLEIPVLMNRFGLILENVDGLENPTEKFLMRSIPHSLSVATSIIPPAPDGDPMILPDGTTADVEQRNGWSGDGAPLTGSLRFFPVGAVIQHAPKRLARDENVDFRLPTDEELDAMEAFMLSVGRTDELDLTQVSLTDPRASAGMSLFVAGVGGAKCNTCHLNAGANSGVGGNRNFDTGTERVRIVALDRLEVPRDGGFGGQNLADFDFDSNGDGVNDSFGNGTFNTPPLIEAADTPPFFHTNASRSIEDAVAFYSTPAFTESPGGALMRQIFREDIALDDAENREVAAFLRVLNAAFNLAIAAQRLEAAAALTEAGGRGRRADQVIDRLLELAGVELKDALQVLSEGHLNRDAWKGIKVALNTSRHAIRTRHPRKRARVIENTLEAADAARESLGEGLEFELGEGNLVY